MNDPKPLLCEAKGLLSKLLVQQIVLANAQLLLGPPLGLEYERRREALDRLLARASHELALPGDRGA